LPLAICIAGPTASGKTDLAIELTKHLPVDIVSVDSALIYKDMDIGTAKPSPEELALAPHRLINMVAPTESYSVARFYNDAREQMDSITAQGRIPLLVGGTMMYYRVLREGIASLPSADEGVRQDINALAAEHGWPYVHECLAQVDPSSAARIKPNDQQRIQRALEVFRVSGKSLTEHWDAQKNEVKNNSLVTGNNSEADYTISGASIPPVPYRLLAFAIAPTDRKDLHARIATRFHMMLQNGFQSEVEQLRSRGDLSLDLPSMRCVGYRQMWEYLDGEYDYERMIEKGIIATRQLAKRQLTWLRRWNDVEWLETGNKNNLSHILNCFKKAASN